MDPLLFIVLYSALGGGLVFAISWLMDRADARERRRDA